MINVRFQRKGKKDAFVQSYYFEDVQQAYLYSQTGHFS